MPATPIPRSQAMTEESKSIRALISGFNSGFGLMFLLLPFENKNKHYILLLKKNICL